MATDDTPVNLLRPQRIASMRSLLAQARTASTRLGTLPTEGPRGGPGKALVAELKSTESLLRKAAGDLNYLRRQVVAQAPAKAGKGES